MPEPDPVDAPQPGFTPSGGYTPLVVAVVAGAMVAAAFTGIDRAEIARFRSRTRTLAVTTVAAARAKLESSIASRFAAVRSLETFVLRGGTPTQAEFRGLAVRLTGDDPAIKALELAPDSVIRFVYPMRGNEASVGANLIQDPDRRGAVLRAIRDRQPVVAGPLDLFSGGSGIVVRTPIFVGDGSDDRYWGLAGLVVELPALVSAAGIGESGDLQFALRGTDGLGHEGGVFFGSPATFASGAVQAPVSIPGGSWILAAVPVRGWPSAAPASGWLRLAGVTLALLVALIAWMTLSSPARLRARIVSATEDVLQREQQLELERELTMAIGGAASETDALESVLRVVGARGGFALGQAWITSPERPDALRCAGSAYEGTPDMEGFIRASRATEVPRGHGLIGDVWESKTPEWVSDVRGLPGYIRRTAATATGLGACLVVPIVAGDETVSVLEFFFRGSKPRDQRLLDLVFASSDALRRMMTGKRMEDAIRDSEARYRAVTESASDAIISADHRGRIVHVNPVALELFGYQSDDLVGRPLTLLMPERFHSDHQSAVDRVARTGEPRLMGRVLELVGRKRDGSEFPIELTLAMWESKGARYFTGILRDVTERRAAREELERSNAELEQFAYVASHDLQEPLRMVRSFGQLLDQRYGESLEGDAKEFLGYMVDGAERMHLLVNDLLSFSRVGSAPRRVVPVPLDEVMGTVTAALQATIAETGASLTADPLPTVLGDPLWLGQVMQNLLANALKFTAEGPPVVRVSAERDGRMWAISVRDEGIGISPEHLERVFLIFQRLHRRDEYAGTGLGLAISRKIVERLGGRIWCESEGEGRGTTFKFTVPGIEIATRAIGEPERAAAERAAEEQVERRRRELI